jgi:hypothetical protein
MNDSTTVKAVEQERVGQVGVLLMVGAVTRTYFVGRVRDLDLAEGEVRAYLWRKTDGTGTYRVAELPGGRVTCTCPGFTGYQHCKHSGFASAFGLTCEPARQSAIELAEADAAAQRERAARAEEDAAEAWRRVAQERELRIEAQQRLAELQPTGSLSPVQQTGSGPTPPHAPAQARKPRRKATAKRQAAGQGAAAAA